MDRRVSTFAERVDRALYLAHLQHHELVRALQEVAPDVFSAAFSDYPGWRERRAKITARALHERAAAAILELHRMTREGR